MSNEQEPIHFPDARKSDLDHAISELMSTAQRVLSAQGRLRSLLDSSLAVVRITDLSSVLRRIAEVALDLVDARYAALGVLSPNGRLEQFIHVGMPPGAAAAIGRLPEGHGILGALIDDPRPIRVDHLGADPRSIGFPPNHPTMESFLGVPIRVRDEVFGNIYVADHFEGGFTEEDEELLTALAATAGIAIDNARLLEDTRRRQRWSAATAEITSALLANIVEDSLGFIAERVVELADADLVSIAVRHGPDSLIVETSRGQLEAQVRGLIVPMEGTLAHRAIASGQPVLADDNSLSDGKPNPWIDLGPSMAIPLPESGHVHRVLTVSRARGSAGFTLADLEMASDFAGQASIALALARGREDQTRLALLEDRGRIARDLHDHAIQRLFSAGLSLQLLDIRSEDDGTRDKISAMTRILDDTITDIRTAIFSLSPTARDDRSIRHGILEAVSESSVGLTVSPRVIFAGAVDLLVSDTLSPDILAVVRESLMNVAKHARASETLLSVAVGDDGVSVDVTDDGVGIPTLHHTSGVRNMERRAVDRGGEFFLRTRESGGSHMHWRVPLEPTKERT